MQRVNRDAAFGRRVCDRGFIGSVRKPRDQVKSGGRAADARGRQPLGQRRDERVAAGAIAAARSPQVPIDLTSLEQRRVCILREHARHCAGDAMLGRQLADEMTRDQEPREAQRRRERLAGSPHIGDAVRGEALKGEARKEASGQAKSIVEKAQAELEAERDKMVEDLRKEFVSLLILASEKVIRQTLDKEKQSKLIEETLEQIRPFSRN